MSLENLTTTGVGTLDCQAHKELYQLWNPTCHWTEAVMFIFDKVLRFRKHYVPIVGMLCFAYDSPDCEL